MLLNTDVFIAAHISEQLQLAEIMTDFKMGVIAAVPHGTSLTTQKGCHFHFPHIVFIIKQAPYFITIE